MMQRLGEYLGRLTGASPFGNANTAYAMIHALDAARVFQYEAFERLLLSGRAASIWRTVGVRQPMNHREKTSSRRAWSKPI